MSNTKYFLKKGTKMTDFLCVFGRNLKLMATGQGCWENSEIFLVTPEKRAQPRLARQKDFENYLFRTP